MKLWDIIYSFVQQVLDSYYLDEKVSTSTLSNSIFLSLYLFAIILFFSSQEMDGYGLDTNIYIYIL